MSPRYFQGKSVTGYVTASTARTFSEVVEKFRICASLPLTRSAFHALSDEERKREKHVPYFTAACFRDDPSKRDTGHATVCNLIFLDIDPEKKNQNGKWVETGRCPAAPFVQHPGSLYTALSGFNFAAHTTASSTPQKPRMRIVVDAEAIPLHRYAQAVATIAALLGLSSVTTESKVAVQPMFLPTLFADSTEEDHPLIAHRCDARAFTEADISDALQDDFGEIQQASRGTVDHGPDALFFLRSAVPEITLAIAGQALRSIDPDCSYHEWLECAAALRHQFSPQKAEEAYTLFDEWSATGDKYAGTEETRAKWDSIRQTPVGRMPVTIRSLLHRAVQSGWDDRKVKDSGFNLLLDWMDNNAESATELLENGVQKILGTPLISAVQESMLIDHLRAAARKRWSVNVTATAIRKDMDRLKAEIRAQATPPDKTREPLWAKGVCYIAAAQDFYRHRTGEKYKETSFNHSYGRHLLPTEEQLKAEDKKVSAENLSKPIVEPAVYALNHLKIPTVYDYAYDPSQPLEMFFVSRGRKYVNTYSPTYPELDYDNAERVGQLYQRHLANLIAEPEHRTTITDYLATMVQAPGRKIRWAPMIQGAEGCGKSYLADLMAAVLGKEHVKKINGTTVTSGWNEWAFGFQLVVLEEVRVVGTSKHDIMNRLKEWITNDSIPINEKFRGSRDIDNITNYMAFSNHHDALALTPNNRRYFVLKSPLQTRAQVESFGPDYFPTIYGALEKHPGAMRAYLHEWDISPTFEPNGMAPLTSYATEMACDTATDLQACVRRLLLEGDHPLVQYDIVSTKSLLDLVQTEEGLRTASQQQLAHVLRDEGFHQVGRCTLGEDRHYLWARHGVNGNAASIAGARLEKGLRHLQAELLF